MTSTSATLSNTSANNTNINDTKTNEETKFPKVNTDNLTRRSIVKHFKAHSQKEGAGFTVHRPIGGPYMNTKESDPFLMLDELGPKVFKKGEFPGAPWHPHRGFDTVMYLKSSKLRHQDSMGNSGILNEGDVQWMTAGSGIIHDEGTDHQGGLLHGFQLWVNLPAKHKMCDPQYQQITAKNFPFIDIADGVKVKVISGSLDYGSIQHESPLKPIVPIHYFDYVFESGHKSYVHIISEQLRKIFETAIVYVYEGVGFVCNGNVSSAKKVGWKKVKRNDCICMSTDGDCIEFKSGDNSSFGFVLLLGQPIREPIAARGPFVMNTKQEIEKCYSDYRLGKLATVKGKSVIY